jgi:replication initiation and membrane attachment protein DnaB
MSNTNESDTSRLNKICREITSLYMDAQKSKDPKKTATYHKISSLNEEAKKIVSNLETMLNNLDTSNQIASTVDNTDLDALTSLMSTQNLDFKELMVAIEKFSGILNGLPTKATVVKHDVGAETIYEEEDVASEEL